MTVPELCAELDELSARREEAVNLSNCPPDLVAVSDRMSKLIAALRDRVRACQSLMIDQVSKVGEERAELLYYTTWSLLKYGKYSK